MPTIASSSICLSMGEGEKLTVEKYSSQIVGSKKNYLLEELMRKLDCLEGEGASLQKHFSKVKDVFEDIMVSAKEVAGKMWSSEVELDLVETGPRSTLVHGPVLLWWEVTGGVRWKSSGKSLVNMESHTELGSINCSTCILILESPYH